MPWMRRGQWNGLAAPLPHRVHQSAAAIHAGILQTSFSFYWTSSSYLPLELSNCSFVFQFKREVKQEMRQLG
jgi:hypothetical protein